MSLSKTDNMDPKAEPYTLYHNFWSSCSLMLRLSLFLSQGPGSSEPVSFKETEIDIQHGGQIDEDFMCNVNPRGQVGVIDCEQAISALLTR